MKHILLFVFLLLSGALLGQQDIVRGKKTGDIIKGEKAAYEVFAAGGYEIKNVEIQDTIWRGHPGTRKTGRIALEGILRQIDEIIFRHFKIEELLVPYEEIYGQLGINFRINKDLRVEKITFEMCRENNFWTQLPVGRFYEIEKEILAKVKMTEEEWEKYGKYRDIENEALYDVYLISYSRLRRTLREMKEEEKNKRISEKNDVFVMLTTDSVVRCNFYNSMEGTSVSQGVYREELYVSNNVIRGTYYLFPKTRKAKYCPLAFTFDLKIDSLTREVRVVDERDQVTLSCDFLEKVKVMDMSKELERIETCEDSEEFCKRLEGKVVWVIDRRTMTDNTVTLVKTRAERVLVDVFPG